MSTTKTEEEFSALRMLSAGVVHEIRNPLAVIQSLVELLAQKTQDKNQQALAKAIVTEVKRLNRFLGEFLQYGRVPELQYETVDIGTLIQKALSFAITPEQNAIQVIRTDIPEHLPQARLDPDAMHQVLVNAILNALQAMQGKGRLEIQVERPKQHLTIKIQDSGPGIPPENLEKIFFPFFTTKRNGSGLGLAISQQIIKQHGGWMVFENNVNEKGVTLVINIPQEQTD